MTKYHIDEGLESGAKRFRYALVWAATWLLFFSVFEHAVHGRWIDETVLAIAGAMFFLGILLTTALWPRQKASVDLEIDDYEIRLVWGRKVVRRVRRDHICYVREWGTGPFRKLVISERGPAGTRWLWGGIGVPASLPEYGEIKTQALAWLERAGK